MMDKVSVPFSLAHTLLRGHTVPEMKRVGNDKDHLGRINVTWETERKNVSGCLGKAGRAARRRACPRVFERRTQAGV